MSSRRAACRASGRAKPPRSSRGSKVFTKEFLARHGIPTAGYRKFTRADFDEKWLATQRAPIVVKASGLAAGKGVIIAMTPAEAVEAARSMLDGRFGDAGNEIVIEEFLDGEEASFIVMCDGTHVLPMASSQDHKRLKDGDQGPNTGGMGAYSPAPVVTPAVHARIMREVIEPTVRGLAADGMPFTGFLYAGLMINVQGAPKVIEYNVRFGDPETQPVLARLNSDLTVLCEAALAGKLDTVSAEWDTRAALGVVIAAPGYPDDVRKGDVITGLDKADQLPGKLFHAGTAQRDGKVVTSGGRVFCAVGLGKTVAAAQTEAYALVDAVDFDGAQARLDIGYRAIARGKAALSQPLPRLPHVPPARLAILRGFFAMTQAVSANLASRAAFQLFLRTFRHPLRAADAALLARAQGRRLNVGSDSIQLHEWAGAGPTAVIVHGWGSSAARFALLAQALNARGWRVLVFDAPGHGASSGTSSSLPQFMAALDAVIADCGPPRALLGHSLGALAIACRHRDGPPAWAGALDSVVLVSMPRGADDLLRKYIDALGLSAATEQRLLERFRRRFHAGPRDYAAMPGAGRIAARMLLVHDRDDDIVAHADSAALQARLHGAQFITTAGQGHSKLTREATTIAQIVDFIDPTTNKP